MVSNFAQFDLGGEIVVQQICCLTNIHACKTILLRNRTAMKQRSPMACGEPRSLDFYTGSVVEAEDLLFREAFIDHLWETLELMHVLLKAPRRCGKTSVMEHLRRYPRNNFAVTFERKLPARLRELLGRPIPLFLQMLTLDLFRSWRTTPRRLKPADVDAEFARFITSTAAQDKLQHFYTRLAKYYAEPALGQAHALLNHLCTTGQDGSSRSVLNQIFDSTWPPDKQPVVHERKRLFQQLLRDLENDFYVVEAGEGRYDFASGIIKAWWRKYYA
jgi:hypothetical protein